MHKTLCHNFEEGSDYFSVFSLLFFAHLSSHAELRVGKKHNQSEPKLCLIFKKTFFGKDLKC